MSRSLNILVSEDLSRSCAGSCSRQAKLRVLGSHLLSSTSPPSTASNQNPLLQVNAW